MSRMRVRLAESGLSNIVNESVRRVISETDTSRYFKAAMEGRCGESRNGYTLVGVMGKWNFINNETKEFVSAQWFDYCDSFRYGYALVGLNGKYNFIGADGNLLSPNQWFDNAYKFGSFYDNDNCRTPVKLNGEWVYVGVSGKLYDFQTKRPIGVNVRELGRQVASESIGRMVSESIGRALRRRQGLLK